MTDDMGFDLKLPAVGELTFPQWQDWLARYNAVLTERADRIEQLEAELVRTFNNMMGDGKRIEKLEAALRDIIVHCEIPARPNAEALIMFARKALEGKDD